MICFVSAEEIKTNKQKYYNDMIKFLGGNEVNEFFENDVHIREYNRPIPKVLEQKLYNIYKQHNEILYEILGRKINIWENYYNDLKCRF